MLLSYPGTEEEKEQDPIYHAIVRIVQDPATVSAECVCDDVFALYLLDLASKVTPAGYQLFVKFLQTLRECLNLKGWSLDGESEQQSTDDVFCEIRTAQNLPEVSNYFITEYIEDQDSPHDRQKFIGLMLHFNAWLFSHRYSNLKLSLIATQ